MKNETLYQVRLVNQAGEIVEVTDFNTSNNMMNALAYAKTLGGRSDGTRLFKNADGKATIAFVVIK